MSNFTDMIKKTLQPTLTPVQNGWLLNPADDYNIKINKNEITLSHKIEEQSNVIISDNYWVGVNSDATEETLDTENDREFIYQENFIFEQTNSHGLINRYNFEEGMKHDIIIQPALQELLKQKKYKSLKFGGEIITNKCQLGFNNEPIKANANFKGQLQVLSLNDNNKILFKFQDIWLKDADGNRLDLTWQIVPQKNSYKFYIEINTDEILSRPADIIIDPSLTPPSTMVSSRHGYGLAATPNGKLAHIFSSNVTPTSLSSKLYLSTSRNDGFTWRTPWIVATAEADGTPYTRGVYSPTLLADENDNIYTCFLGVSEDYSCNIYLRKMLPDDSFETEIKISTNETLVAVSGHFLYSDYYAIGKESTLDIYDAYIVGNKLIIIWWSSDSQLNQSLIIREVNLDTMSLSSTKTVSGIIGNPSSATNYYYNTAYTTVLIRPHNDVIYIGVNYGVLDTYQLNFSLIEYNPSTQNATVAFTNEYFYISNTIRYIGNRTIGVTCFDIINNGNSVLVLIQDTDSSADVAAKIYSMTDGSTVNENVAMITFSLSEYQHIIPFISDNGDKYWCNSQNLIRINNITGEMTAILPSNPSKLEPYQTYDKYASRVAYKNKIFHSFNSVTVGYTALGGDNIDTEQPTRNFLNFWDTNNNSNFLPDHSVYVDPSNIGHAIVAGKYYRSTNAITDKPTLADFNYVDNVPSWGSIGYYSSQTAAIYYDHLSDNLYIFIINQTEVNYCRRHAGVYTALQTLNLGPYPTIMQQSNGINGVLSDKNNDIICTMGVRFDGSVPTCKIVKVTVETDELSEITTSLSLSYDTIQTNTYYAIGKAIKNNTGDILIPYIGTTSATNGSGSSIPGYLKWDGNVLTNTAIPTKTYNPVTDAANYSYGLYGNNNRCPFVTNVYMHQDFQGEYYITFQYPTQDFKTIFAMIRTFNGLWQSDTLDNIIPLETNCEPLGIHMSATRFQDGIGKYVFHAMLNPWRNKLIVALPYLEKNIASNYIHVPGLRWMEYDTQNNTWDNATSLTGYENAIIPTSTLQNRGVVLLRNNYGDPRICFIEAGDTNLLGKLNITEIDYTQARINNTAPESPRVRSPLTQTSLYNTTTPSLSWYVAPDAQFDNQHYIVEISTTQDFLNIIGSVNSSNDQTNFRWYYGGAELPFPSIGVNSAYGTYENPSMYVIFNTPQEWGLELNTEYYWRIKPIG